jgi:hypothetical protein
MGLVAVHSLVIAIDCSSCISRVLVDIVITIGSVVVVYFIP